MCAPRQFLPALLQRLPGAQPQRAGVPLQLIDSTTFFSGSPHGPRFADEHRNRWYAYERPAVASVTADPGAIAPALPLPSRPDAAPPAAGSSNAFADLLDGTTPPTASQPQSAATSPGQSGAPATSGNGSAQLAATGVATAGPRAGKDDGGKDTSEQLPAVDVTLLAGLALQPLALAAPPNADQTPATLQDPHDACTAPAPATGGAASDTPSDRKAAHAASG